MLGWSSLVSFCDWVTAFTVLFAKHPSCWIGCRVLAKLPRRQNVRVDFFFPVPFDGGAVSAKKLGKCRRNLLNSRGISSMLVMIYFEKWLFGSLFIYKEDSYVLFLNNAT